MLEHAPFKWKECVHLFFNCVDSWCWLIRTSGPNRDNVHTHVQGASVGKYLAHGAIFSASCRLRQNPAPPVANQNRTSLWVTKHTHTQIFSCIIMQPLSQKQKYILLFLHKIPIPSFNDRMSKWGERESDHAWRKTPKIADKHTEPWNTVFSSFYGKLCVAIVGMPTQRPVASNTLCRSIKYSISQQLANNDKIIAAVTTSQSCKTALGINVIQYPGIW